MGLENGTTRSSQPKGQCERSKLGGESESLGEVSGASGEPGSYEVGTGGANSDGRNTFASKERGSHQDGGKVVDQLADEVDEEISYYESRISQLKSRSKQLRQLSGELEKTDNSD